MEKGRGAIALKLNPNCARQDCGLEEKACACARRTVRGRLAKLRRYRTDYFGRDPVFLSLPATVQQMVRDASALHHLRSE